MVDIGKIEQSIAELEQMDTSYSVCSKLAELYIVRDHMLEKNRKKVYGDTEFLKCVSGCDTKRMLSAIDELMSTMKVINPQAYDMVLYKIRSE